MVVWKGLLSNWGKKRNEKQRRKGKIYPIIWIICLTMHHTYLHTITSNSYDIYNMIWKITLDYKSVNYWWMHLCNHCSTEEIMHYKSSRIPSLSFPITILYFFPNWNIILTSKIEKKVHHGWSLELKFKSSFVWCCSCSFHCVILFLYVEGCVIVKLYAIPLGQKVKRN